MIVYVESSALLAWLLREPDAARVEAIMDAADVVIASDLTLIECHRAIHRQSALGKLSAQSARLAADLSLETASWVVLGFTPAIVERASQAFPIEPIRTLDALHVAFALRARSENAAIALLSLDERIRRVGNSLGLDILPA